MKNKKSYYEILGVDVKANENEIRQAYHELALKNHPDLYPGNREKEENMKIINEAYLALRNSKSQIPNSKLFGIWCFGFEVFFQLWLDSLLKWNRFWFSPVRSKGKREGKGNGKSEIPFIKNQI